MISINKENILNNLIIYTSSIYSKGRLFL